MSYTFKPLQSILIASVMGLALTQAACTQAETQTQSIAVAEQTAPKLHVTHVDAKGALALLKSKPDTIVLDVRTPEEISGGHIDGAVFANFYDKDFAQQLTMLDRETSYIVHCRSGGRSTKALKTLEELGFTSITHMDGGFKGWKSANLPVKMP